MQDSGILRFPLIQESITFPPTLYLLSLSLSYPERKRETLETQRKLPQDRKLKSWKGERKKITSKYREAISHSETVYTALHKSTILETGYRIIFLHRKDLLSCLETLKLESSRL